MGTVIVVTSGKGGTGKTSIAGAVASCLAALGKRTLCIDGDVGLRNLDITLGLSDRAVMSFYDVLAGNTTLEKAAVEHPVIHGLFLLTAPMNISAEDISLWQMEQLLTQVRAEFDFCLIDSPAGLGAGFRLSAAHADQAIVVATADLSSLRDAEKTACQLERLGVSNNYMVVNRVSPKLLNATESTIDDAMDTTGLPLIGLVPEDPGVYLAANMGIPLILNQRKGAAVACLNIAQRLCGIKAPLMKIR